MKTKNAAPVCKTGDGKGTSDKVTHGKNNSPSRVCQAEECHG